MKIVLIATVVLASGLAWAAPDLSWTDLTGSELSLADYDGRILVLNFWATWCAPCVKEMPDLVRIQNRYGIYGVQVLGISADPVAERDQVVEFAQKTGLNFPIGLGSRVGDMQAFDVGMVLPATVVIDRDGDVVKRVVGVFDRGELEAVLDRLVRGEELEEDDHDHAAHDHAAEPHDEHDHVAQADAHDHRHEPSKGTRASLVPS